MTIAGSTTAAEVPPRRLDDLPSPKGLPLLGNLFQLDALQLHRVLERWHAELGSPYRLRFGPQKVFVSADPELLHAVLRERPERYRRLRAIESVIAEVGGNGVFSVEGQKWRPQRLLVMRAINPTHFRGFFPAMQAITERLRRRWQAAAERGETVEMTQDLKRYTVDVTTALAFGEDPNTIEQGDDAIQQHLAEVFPMLEARINAPFPLWRYLKLPKDRRFDRALAAIHAHVEGLIERARRRMHGEASPAPRNVLEALLAARDEPGSRLSDADVRANVFTLLMAGEDTTANALAWTMPYLAADPAWQARLHAAACEAFRDARVCPNHDNLRRLDAFEATTTEAMRLRPIVPVFFLEPLADVVLGGVELPAGTPLFFLLRPAMLDELRFARAQRFEPERWLGGVAQHALPHDPRAYLQFGAGPRVCPGRHLAAVEIRLVLSMLMRSFSIELAIDPARIREVMAFAMMPSAMPVRLRAVGSASHL